MIIVGDAFAKPILATLDAHPGRWDLSSLVAVISSGVMWSEETKQGLLRHHPDMLLIDAFGRRRPLGIGTSVSSDQVAAKTAQFTLGPDVRVIDADGRDVEPGSGRSGVLALGGRIPVGYYKDEDKSAATFRDHRRHPLLGARRLRRSRTPTAPSTCSGGARCASTPAARRSTPKRSRRSSRPSTGVVDAVVVGIPDERFGEEIVAVVELARDAGGSVTPEGVIEHVKGRLAGYKAPRRVRLRRRPSVGPLRARSTTPATAAETAEWRGRRAARREPVTLPRLSPCWPRASGRSR